MAFLARILEKYAKKLAKVGPKYSFLFVNLIFIHGRVGRWLPTSQYI